MLHLPASYGIKVADAVGLDTDATNTENAAGGILLVAKICDALTKSGYGDEDIKKVGDLVSQNLVTCGSSQVHGLEENDEERTATDDAEKSGLDATRGQVDLILKSLLDKNVRRSRSVNMNSNEPVVLINQSTRTDRISMNRVVDETITQLQQTWNIWPVRIYAGPFVETPEDFSITLLNVVNTDIGGPSMVQLLDLPCDAPEWHKFVRREAWRDREFLYRQDGKGQVAPVEHDAHVDDGSEKSAHSEDGDDSTDSESLDPIAHEAPTQRHEATPLQDVEELHTDPAETPYDAEPKPEDPSELQELDLPEKRIDHPTWERPHDTVSLLDLIRSQATKTAPVGMEEGSTAGPRPGAGLEDVESAAEVLDAASDKDGEFVVV